MTVKTELIWWTASWLTVVALVLGIIELTIR